MMYLKLAVLKLSSVDFDELYSRLDHCIFLVFEMYILSLQILYFSGATLWLAFKGRNQ